MVEGESVNKSSAETTGTAINSSIHKQLAAGHAYQCMKELLTRYKMLQRFDTEVTPGMDEVTDDGLRSQFANRQMT